LQRALVAGLDGAQAAADLLRDDARIQLAVHCGRLALHNARDLLLGRSHAGLAARDAGTTAQTAYGRDPTRAGATGLDSSQGRVAAGDAHAADALERPLLVPVDVALAQHVRQRTAAVGLGAQQFQQ